MKAKVIAAGVVAKTAVRTKSCKHSHWLAHRAVRAGVVLAALAAATIWLVACNSSEPSTPITEAPVSNGDPSASGNSGDSADSGGSGAVGATGTTAAIPGIPAPAGIPIGSVPTGAQGAVRAAAPSEFVDFECNPNRGIPDTSGPRLPIPGSSPRESVVSALLDPDHDSFEALVDLSEIKSGGVAIDGIPTIDAPCYELAETVEHLGETAPVMAVEINGDARAFPLGIMTRHELVNTAIGGKRVTVSYCPLCNSGVVYDRQVGTRILDFGVSGRLYQSSLVMYDRQTQSLWTHFNGQAIVGELAGARLSFFPTQIIAWGQWREANPKGAVLSRDTGYYSPESYNVNPYAGYDTSPSLLSPNFQSEDIDTRLPAKERVLGVVGPTGDSVAIQREHLREAQVQHFSLGEGGDKQGFVAFSVAGTSSALDTAVLDQGQDVGAAGVFLAAAEGRPLTFEPLDAGGGTATAFRDVQTGSTWNILGQATAGELAGQQLPPVVFWDTFWFAWATFAKNTEILEKNR